MLKPRRTTLAASIIIFLVFSVGCAQEPNATTDDVSLGMVYYVNYGRDVSGPPWSPVGGLGSRGWNDITFENLWTGFVTNRPALGFYDSADPNVIDSHLRQMDAIGVDFLLISYLGWGDADLDGNLDEPVYINAPEHEVVQRVFASSQQRGRQFFRTVGHPETVEVEYPGLPFHFSETSEEAGRAPLLGEHNSEILATVGYNRQDLVDLARAGVI